MQITKKARQAILERSGGAQDGLHSQGGSTQTKTRSKAPALWADLMGEAKARAVCFYVAVALSMQ